MHTVGLLPAGSERVDKSGVTGQQLKEAQNINRSLSALGDVISALQSKAPHVPYRNSKLTQVIKERQSPANVLGMYGASAVHARPWLDLTHRRNIDVRSTILQVLQDSLCGSAKVLLMCCVSPDADSTSETLSSLNFATRASQVELGPVRRAAEAGSSGAVEASFVLCWCPEQNVLLEDAV